MITHESLLDRYNGLSGIRAVDVWPFIDSQRARDELATVARAIGGQHWTKLAESQTKLLTFAGLIRDDLPFLTGKNFARLLPALLIVCEYATEASQSQQALLDSSGMNLNSLKDNIIYSLDPLRDLVSGIREEYSHQERNLLFELFPKDAEEYDYLDFNYESELANLLED